MATTYYFNGSMSAAEMKALYKALAKKHHPDLGGDLETMKTINAEYAHWVSRAGTQETKQQKQEQYGKYNESYDAPQFIKDLEAAIKWILDENIGNIPGIDASIAGVFIWVNGEVLRSMPSLRESLKGAGFRYSPNKRAWYFTPTNYHGGVYNPVTMDHVFRTYGKDRIRKNDRDLTA